MAGFGLNLKLVLYLQSQCLTESLGFLNPPLLQAAKRCMKPLSNKRSKKLKNNVMKLIRKKLVQGNSPPKKKDYIYIFNIINLHT